MKKLLYSLALIAAVAFLIPQFPSHAQKSPDKPVTKFRKAKKPIKNEYIVVLRNDIPKGDVEPMANALARLHGGRLMGVFQHALKGFGIRLPEAAAKALANHPQVEFVEENAQSEPLEPMEEEVWGYYPYGGEDELQPEAAQAGVPSWGLDRIDQSTRFLDGVYRYNRTGQGVDVYIVDSGILFSHTEFGGRAIRGYDYFRASSDPNHGVDCHGHGTHVAGIVGGRTYGAAKNVRLYSVRVLDCAGGGSAFTALSGVNWAVGNYNAQIPKRPAVMNISLAFSYYYDYYASSLDSAVNYASQQGITVAVAAGNNNGFTGYFSPQAVPAAINVGATNDTDTRASFSNFGSIDLFAPGEGIPSAGISSTTSIVKMSGTSMASPFTAGVAAMYLEAFPTALPATVEAAIVNNATNGVVINADPWGGAYTPNKLLYSFFVPPPPHIIFFSAANYSVNESNGSITITVNRTGNDLPPVTVSYATSDGTAQQRSDYNITLGKLSFGAGQTSKTFTILITDDGYVEGNETVNLTLSNPTGGASLGVPNKAVLTIVSNDSVASQPIDNTAFFVRQHYVDFLGREPDAGGFQGWQNILNNCPPSGHDANGNWCDRIEVSAGFFRSEEFQSRGYFIYRFYSAIGRIPVYSEFMPDFAKVSGFLSAQDLEANKAAFVNEFMTRQEFRNRYDALTTPTAYVDGLLQTVGLPNHPSRGYWIDGLSNGSLTRAQVLRSVVESAEVYQKYYNEAFVIMQYFGYLRRTADASYVDWINVMNQTGGDYRIMINGFMNSAEYRQRFGP